MMRSMGWLATVLVATAAVADEPVELRVIPHIPNLAARHQVEGVDAKGGVRLKPSGVAEPDQIRLILGGAVEGHQLLIADRGGDGGPLVLRVQVTEVGADGLIAATTTPEAAALLKAGEAVDLARPHGSTTAQIRALPAVIARPKAAAAPAAPGEDPAEAAREAAARIRSINNMKQIGLAMHNFHSTYNTFPPAVIFGPDGKPWHSWRVLLLPYLEHANLYNQYDFAEPWDSEKNRKILEQMPDVYRDPIYNDPKGHFTHYAVPVGDNTMFSPDGPEIKDKKNPPIAEKGTRIQEITDGTSNTILVVPIDPKAEIPWTRPDDLLVLPAFPGLGEPGGIAAPYKAAPGKGAKRVSPVLFGDGSVRTIADSINKLTLAALLTKNGGEVIAADAIPDGGGNNNAGVNMNQPRILTIRIDGDQISAGFDGQLQPPVVERAAVGRPVAPPPPPGRKP